MLYSDLLEELGITRPTIRQRLIADRSTRIGRYLLDQDRVLQDARRAGVLPKHYTESLRAAQSRLRDEIGLVERQNEAERADEELYRRSTPLERQRHLRRPNAPIEGILEREREKTRKLSREQFDRAQALAASRRRKLLSERATARFHGEKLPPLKKATHYAEETEGISLCDWWHRRKRDRRRTLIARNLRKRRGVTFEQRHERKHVKKFAMEFLCGSA